MPTNWKMLKDEHTETLQLRLVRIGNGWLIRAGAEPHFCATPGELESEVLRLTSEFLKATSIVRIEEKK